MLKHDFASHIDNLKCATKPRSEALGRHLWTCTIDADSYWLKFHLPNVHAQSEQDFCMNCNFMKICSIKVNWLLPFKIIEGSTVSQQLQFQGRVLVYRIQIVGLMI